MEETRKAIEELIRDAGAFTAELDTKQKSGCRGGQEKKDADAKLPSMIRLLPTPQRAFERANKLIPQQEMLVAAETGILTTAQQTLDALKNTPNRRYRRCF